MKQTVLFLCTHNSCRSQMAEGLVNHFLGDAWHAYSAGTEPSSVHPMAVQVMDEVGIDLSGRNSKSVDSLPDMEFDCVITLCSDADRNCPFFRGSGKRVHIGFDDPAQATGTGEEVLVVFRTIRDQMRDKVFSFLNSYT